MAAVVNTMLVSVTLELKHIIETNLISIYTYILILCYLHGTSWLLSFSSNASVALCNIKNYNAIRSRWKTFVVATSY